jgi:hypothetical protein
MLLGRTPEAPRRKRVWGLLARAGLDAGAKCIVDNRSQGHPALARQHSQAGSDVRIEIDRRAHVAAP